jgi:P-type E1-E2 ATPase
MAAGCGQADMVRAVQAATRRRVCAIGDGGNDVSMIQAADVGPSARAPAYQYG